jgi:hypothetical protein
MSEGLWGKIFELICLIRGHRWLMSRVPGLEECGICLRCQKFRSPDNHFPLEIGAMRGVSSRYLTKEEEEEVLERLKKL